MIDEPERYKGNIHNPLVKRAAGHQVRVRNSVSSVRSHISECITTVSILHGQDELLTYLIGECSDPDVARRQRALDELDRLFNGEPDGRLPDQEPFQAPVPEDEDKPDEDAYH